MSQGAADPSQSALPEHTTAIAQPRRNVELKARDPIPRRSLAACEERGAEAHGTLVQRDTYFRVPHGRLKLREEKGAVPHLIAYERPDLAGQRKSRYWIVELDRPDELMAALSSEFGVKAVIAKERRLFLWEGVRIHLDQVDGLGHFIEFEAAASLDSDLSYAEAKVKSLCRTFEVDDANMIEGSYCDLADALPLREQQQLIEKFKKLALFYLETATLV